VAYPSILRLLKTINTHPLKEGYAMRENTFFDGSKVQMLSLDEIARQGAQEMLRMALQAELKAYMESVADERLADGRRAVVRNGNHRSRMITIGSGTIEAVVPRARHRMKQSGAQDFSSSIIPPYMRRSPKIDEVVPLLYLRGLSTGDIFPALEKLLGKETSGLSAANVSRLKTAWEHEYAQWHKRDLSEKRYCYIWADGIHFNVRFGDNRLCVLVVIGATPDGEKELITVASGYRESVESWSYVLRDLKERGLKEPKLATADGALGFWGALADVFPECKWQRCWVHKTANVLDKMHKAAQGRAKTMLHEIYLAGTRKDAEKGFDAFIATFEAKYPKAVQCLTKDREHLFAFFDFPAYHWKHIRSTNTIESPFATVRLRTNKTRGHGTEKSTHMFVFKLLEQAQQRWHKLAGSNLIPLVLAGANFIDGELIKAA
jgi:transposase-like protein